jgi:hypothetical protein
MPAHRVTLGDLVEEHRFNRTFKAHRNALEAGVATPEHLALSIRGSASDIALGEIVAGYQRSRRVQDRMAMSWQLGLATLIITREPG